MNSKRHETVVPWGLGFGCTLIYFCVLPSDALWLLAGSEIRRDQSKAPASQGLSVLKVSVTCPVPLYLVELVEEDSKILKVVLSGDITDPNRGSVCGEHVQVTDGDAWSSCLIDTCPKCTGDMRFSLSRDQGGLDAISGYNENAVGACLLDSKAARQPVHSNSK